MSRCSWRCACVGIVLGACGPGPRQPPPQSVTAVGTLIATAPRTVRDDRNGIELVLVRNGEFTMGGAGRDEVPRHRVRLTEAYWLARTEVTIRQWRAFLDAGGTSDAPVPTADENLPMPASHDDAVAFCRFYGYTLPTEAQWEWACRAGDDSVPTSIDLEAMRAHAWYHHNAGEHAMPVGTRTANAFGLRDMLGNVWEWCSDWYVPYAPAERPCVDPHGPDLGVERVLRGGSWFSLPPALPSTRAHEPPSRRSAFFGFRPACARSAFE
ncbi:MAG: SUMF1/EgtB/PvdO family nonheme iron enzyme [Planctomycetota bacterium]